VSGSANASENHAQRADRRARGLRWIGGVGIAVIAVMRCAIFFAPHIVFDVDPAFDPSPIGGLGPAGSLWLDVALLLCAACGFAGEALSNRRIDRVLIVLAFLPLPIVGLHGFTDAGDLWRGMTWASAAIACACLAHLAREPRLRIVLIALLVAAIVPILMRGIANVSYEHQANVRLFEENEQRILAENGWAPDSANARIFERRLRQNHPRGWFITTNIFGSFTAFAVVLWVGLAIGAAKARLESGLSGAAGLLALLAAGGLWMTGSRGAILAAIAGLVLLLLPLVSAHLRKVFARVGPVIALLCVAAALGGVVLRGAVLPEGFAGEKSLLFRWHYMVSSASVFAEHPIIGVGPDGYQAAYVKHRAPHNPEEVTSPHSMFWDWVCTLGIAGAAWIVLVLILLWRVARSLRAPPDSAMRDRGESDRSRDGAGAIAPAAIAAAIVALFGLVPALLVELHTLVLGGADATTDWLGLILRVFGIGGFVLVAVLAAYVLDRAERWIIGWALAAAVIALLVHGQIEMTFTRPNAAVWCFAVLGVAGGAIGGEARDRVRPVGPVASIVALLAAAWVVATGAIPATKQRTLMIEAAETLRPLAEARKDGEIPPRRERIKLRTAAADILVRAHEAMPTAIDVRRLAAEQLDRAQASARDDHRVRLLLEELDLLEYCIQRGDHGRAAMLAYNAHNLLYEITGDASHRDRAIEMARLMTEADPYGLGGWMRLGDALWKYERIDDAVHAYRRALEISDNFELDPLKQLTEREREQIEQRLRIAAETQ
jgi:hypothetical protein